MYYYIITNAILILFFLAFFYLIFQWLRKDVSFKEILYLFAFSLGIAIIFKFPFSYHFFGLEYEDSYIYNFSARQLFEGIYPISFLTDGICIGSISSPSSTFTYGGHFITYPVFLNWGFHIFGYDIHYASYLNTFIEFLTILSLSISFRTIFKIRKYWFIPGLIYSLAPSMNLFGTAHSAETFSSFIVLVSILSLYYYHQSNKKLILIVFIISFFTAIITKRENMMIIILVAVYSTYKFFISNENRIKSLFPGFLSIITIVIYFAFVQNILLVEQNEATDISTQTFTLSNFLSLVPIFINALLNFKWFNIFSFLLIASVIFILYKGKKFPFLLSLITLYFSFFFAYTFHYRSYYFVHFGEVNPFESLRYLNNFFIISTLIISLTLCNLFLNNTFRKLVLTSIPILLGLSFVYTNILRKEFSIIEEENRFTNPRIVLEQLSGLSNYTLITDNTLIFQLLGNKELDIIDFNMLNNTTSNFYKRNTFIFLSNHNKNDNFKYRYPYIYNRLQLMEKKEILKFKNNDSLYKIE